MWAKKIIFFFAPGNSVVCPSEDVWPEAKANFTAKLQCNPNELGLKSRNCRGFTNPGTWEQVIPQCVNKEIQTLLTEAQV